MPTSNCVKTGERGGHSSFSPPNPSVRERLERLMKKMAHIYIEMWECPILLTTFECVTYSFIEDFGRTSNEHFNDLQGHCGRMLLRQKTIFLDKFELFWYLLIEIS